MRPVSARPVPSSPILRARRLAGQVVRRAARPALAGPGSPVQDVRDDIVELRAVLAHESAAVHDLAIAARRFEERLQQLPLLVGRTASLDAAVTEGVQALELVRRRVQSAEELIEGTLAPLEDFARRSQSEPYMQDAPFTVLEQEDGSRVLGYDDDGDAREDRYRAFEDVFRGSEERVRDLQRPYRGVLGDRAPVLDLGCGRGEFLDLLSEWGLEGFGVDSDEGMVARCAEKGHRVRQGDGVELLAEQEDGSLGAVFSAQVVEHLPFAVLERLLALAVDKLRPGGVFVAETVNPHAPDALKAFWLDPTHEHPLFPEVMLTLARIAGFPSAYVFFPTGSGDPDRDRGREPAYALVGHTRA
jgi:SAM-dependent methyltransferase